MQGPAKNAIFPSERKNKNTFLVCIETADHLLCFKYIQEVHKCFQCACSLFLKQRMYGDFVYFHWWLFVCVCKTSLRMCFIIKPSWCSKSLSSSAYSGWFFCIVMPRNHVAGHLAWGSNWSIWSRPVLIWEFAPGLSDICPWLGQPLFVFLYSCWSQIPLRNTRI
jgi:hypothetical protein